MKAEAFKLGKVCVGHNKIGENKIIKKILVVDDAEFMSTVITKVLSNSGYSVSIAKNGEQALEFIKKEKPDLILLDVIMTGISGYDVLEALRTDFRYNLIPIIILSGQSEEEDILKGLELGADDYIIKPFNPRELLARVNNTLVRLERNRGVNPLTGLRGNNEIELELNHKIAADANFAVLYMDLNSFKPYNDIYGFGNGDLAIKLTADIISEAVAELGEPSDFVGHIGGDDFIAIVSSTGAIPISSRIIEIFDESVKQLYSPEDIKNGYIYAEDRYGNLMKFPLIGISIAIAFSEKQNITDMVSLTEMMAGLKNEAKTIADGRSAYVY